MKIETFNTFSCENCNEFNRIPFNHEDIDNQNKNSLFTCIKCNHQDSYIIERDDFIDTWNSFATYFSPKK